MRDPEDGRSSRFVLTAAMVETAQPVSSTVASLNEEVLQALAEQEGNALFKGLAEVAAAERAPAD